MKIIDVEFSCVERLSVAREKISDAALVGRKPCVRPSRGGASPSLKARAESFMRTFNMEDIYTAGYETFADVAERLPRFIGDDPKWQAAALSLGYGSPTEFENQLDQRAA
ncbi:hypothetical protein [Oryzicola mucosus]|uniref:Uncharacterized protein n=1 Tax=Oryzicola mucosus TaxID=2767425 RepID=A0A8J6PM90_9HYPH|nr:hypothetical protein [Oryzicola mucosus]MBD0417199.1 hypothetical protein [Oryzicola mucosus]